MRDPDLNENVNGQTTTTPSDATTTQPIVSKQTLKGSAPDLTEQIKPIADHVFAMATGQAERPRATPSRMPSKKEPTARLDAGELRKGHAALAEPRALPPRESRTALLAGGAAILALAVVGGFALRPLLTGGKSPVVVTAPMAVPDQATHLSKSWAKFPPLPDPAITPGEVDTVGPAQPIRGDVQQKVLRAYGVKPGTKFTVIARLVPAEMGGTDGVKNVFPLTPWFANLKARLDKQLVAEWRAGKLSVEDAWGGLARDWIELVHKRGIRNYGHEDEAKAREEEKKLKW